jgi:hypothetical protein
LNVPIRDGIIPSGTERERDARIKPSDIADAKRQASRDASAQGRRMLNAVVTGEGADGPIPDEATT